MDEMIDLAIVMYSSLLLFPLIVYVGMAVYEIIKYFKYKKAVSLVVQRYEKEMLLDRDCLKATNQAIELLRQRLFVFEEKECKHLIEEKERQLLKTNSNVLIGKLIRECHARGCEITIRQIGYRKVHTDNRLFVSSCNSKDKENLYSIRDYAYLRGIEDITGHGGFR